LLGTTTTYNHFPPKNSTTTSNNHFAPPKKSAGCGPHSGNVLLQDFWRGNKKEHEAAVCWN